MSVNTTRFRVRKAAGSPSVLGAAGIETLASHAANPSAHPDYVKKGAFQQGFDRTEHLAAKLDHAANYLRRAEVITSKLDYERTKKMSLATDSNNYAAKSGTLRYVVTSYILNQILTDLGLTDTSTFFKKAYIVTMSSTPPTSGLDSYVPGYDLFKVVRDKVLEWSDESTGIEATYLKQVDAAATYLTLENAGTPPTVGTIMDEVNTVKAQIGKIGYEQCEAGEMASATTNYYTYNSTKNMFERVAVAEGTILTTAYYKRDTEDTVEQRIADIETSSNVAVKTFTAEENTAGTVINAWTYSDAGFTSAEFDSAVFDVELVGTKTIGGVGYTYRYKNPLGEISGGTTSSPTGYIPHYVPAKSLLYTVNGVLKMLLPYSWLDPFNVTAASEGIQDMETLKIRLIARKGTATT